MKMILPETLLSLCFSFQAISTLFLSNHLLFFMRCFNEVGQIVPLCQSQQNICPFQTSGNFRNPTIFCDVLKRNCVIMCNKLSNWFGKQWHACPRLRIPIFHANLWHNSKKFEPNVCQLMTHNDTLGIWCFFDQIAADMHPTINEPKFLYSREHLAVKLSLFGNLNKMFTTTLFSCFPENNWILHWILLFPCHFSRTNRKVFSGCQKDLRKLTCEKVARSLTKPRRHPPTDTPEPEHEECWRWYCANV